MPGQAKEEVPAEPPVTEEGQRAWDIRLPTVIIGVLALLVFAGALGNGWVGWDDEAYITTSGLMTEPGGLMRIWASTEPEQYYPVTFSTFWIEYQLWGRNPLGYHATNIVLHAVNTCLLLFMLRAIGVSRWTACVVALFFAVHPLQVMSVAWVAQRKNLLSCCFCLIAYLAWVRFRRQGKEAWYFGSLAAFAAGLLSKTAVLTFPLALAALDWCQLKKPPRSTVWRVIPMLALSAAAVFLTTVFEQGFLAEEPTAAPEPAARPLIAAAGILFYVGKLLWPANLLPIYPRWDVTMASPAWWIPILLFAAALIGVWRWRRTLRGTTLFGLVHFVVFLLPMLGLVAYANLALTYVSDHYVYVACIGFFLVVAGGLEQACVRSVPLRKWATGMVGVVVLAACITGIRHVSVFNDARSMWMRTLEGNPDSYTAHAGLGQFFSRQKSWGEAVAHYRRAVELRPDAHPVRLALGQAQMESGDFAAAELTFQQVTDSQPELAEPVLGLAFIAERRGRIPAAIELYERALEIDPDNGELHVRLGKAYLGLSEQAEAARHFQVAIDLNPDDPWAYLGLATCRRGQGRAIEAVGTLEEGLRVAPENVSLLNLLARILATAPDDKVRNGERAVALAQRACDAMNYEGCLTLDTLAAAYAEVGDFDRAVTTAERAAALAESHGYTHTAGAIRETAARYESGEPLREIATNLTLE